MAKSPRPLALSTIPPHVPSPAPVLTNDAAIAASLSYARFFARAVVCELALCVRSLLYSLYALHWLVRWPRFDFGHLWRAHVFLSVADCWARPVTSAPSRVMNVQKGGDDDAAPVECLNFSSYNYLGLEQDVGGAAHKALLDYGVAQRQKAPPVFELEERLARFLGVEAVRTCATGYATNAATLCALVGERSLVVSDSLNHASLVAGCRLSGARIAVFEHNDVSDLERVLDDAFASTQSSDGADRADRAAETDASGPFDKVVVVVEGIYSMEGDMPPLAAIFALRERYRFHVWIDEAHSLGALGKRGRGATEQQGFEPRDADVVVGTFSKAFSSVGGFVAGRRAVVEAIDDAVAAAHSCGEVLPAAAAGA